MITSALAEYESNEANRRSLSYAATARPLRELLLAAAKIRDTIDHLVYRRLTYLCRAHSAMMVRGAQILRLHRMRTIPVEAAASAVPAAGEEDVSPIVDPRSLRVLVGRATHNGGVGRGDPGHQRGLLSPRGGGRPGTAV
jgi:hypothetical protein